MMEQGWPDAVVFLGFCAVAIIFFGGWPKIIVHRKCNCKDGEW